VLRATLRGLLARKVRLLLSGLAVVLGVMCVAGAFVVTDTLGRSFDALYADAYGGTQVRVQGRPAVRGEDTDATVPVPAALVRRTAEVPGVATATGLVAEDGARVIGTDGKVVGSGGRPRLGTNWVGDAGEARLRAGRGPRGPGEVALNAALAKAAGVDVGDRVGILTRQPKRLFTVVGTLEYQGGRASLGGRQEVAFHESVAGELMLGQPGLFTAVDVRAGAGIGPAELRDRLSAALGAGYEVRTGDELRREQTEAAKQELGTIGQILAAFAAISLFVGIFLILNTFSIIVAQRTRELALLRALGAGRRQVVLSVLVEAAAIGLVASVVGLALGVGAGALFAWLFGRLGGDAMEVAGFAVPPAAVLAALAVGVGVTMLAALPPALRTARIPPMAALREAATPDRPLTRLTVAGVVIGGVGGGLLTFGLTRGVETPLALIGGGVLVSLVGVALLTPVIARPVVGLIGRLFAWSVPGRLGRLNSARNPRRTAITAAALMVGIALVTGVNTVLTSATASFGRTIDRQLSADLFISSGDTGGRPPTFDPAVLDRARAVPGVRAAAGEYWEEAVVGDRTAGVAATNDVPGLVTALGLATVDGSLAGLAPDQFLVDADTAADRGIGVGSPMRFTFARGQTRTLTLAGTYRSDWSGGWILPDSVVPDLATPQPAWGYLVLEPGAPVDEVRRRVAALLVDSPEVTVVDRDGFLGQVTGVFDTVLLMVQLLLGLAMVIAVLGIVNTLALSVLERTRELGLLRAVGLDRRQAMRMVTVEAVVISTFGALLGVAVGVGLGATVVRALRDDGVEHLSLPWGFLTVYLVVGSAVGVLAALLPAIRAARVDVLRAISHE